MVRVVWLGVLAVGVGGVLAAGAGRADEKKVGEKKKPDKVDTKSVRKKYEAMLAEKRAETGDPKWVPKPKRPNELKEDDLTHVVEPADGTPAVFRVREVVDKGAAVVSWRQTWFWLETNTTKWADDDKVPVKELVYVPGTKPYKPSTGGTKTLRRLVVIP